MKPINLDPERWSLRVIRLWIVLIIIVAMIALLSVLGGCVGQIPKSYTWDKVNCQYQREARNVKATCELEGTAELDQPELGNVFD